MEDRRQTKSNHYSSSELKTNYNIKWVWQAKGLYLTHFFISTPFTYLPEWETCVMSCYSRLTSDRIMGSIVDDNVFQVYWTLLTYYSLRSHVHYCCTITIQAKHLFYILYRLPHYHHMSQGTTFPTRLHVCSAKTLFSLHISRVERKTIVSQMIVFPQT